MAATRRKNYRLSDATLAKIADLAARWGGVVPATDTTVVVEAIDRAHAAEFVAAAVPAPAARKVRPDGR